MRKNKNIVPLKDLNLTDRFLFDEVLEDKDTKYYILHYLSYAKKHYPKVYNGIIKNRKFCLAYRQIEGSYIKLIRQYGKDLKKMQKLMAGRGYEVRITDDEVEMVYDGYGIGVGRYSSDYKRLQKELGKSRYKTIHKKLVK